MVARAGPRLDVLCHGMDRGRLIHRTSGRGVHDTGTSAHGVGCLASRWAAQDDRWCPNTVRRERRARLRRGHRLGATPWRRGRQRPAPMGATWSPKGRSASRRRWSRVSPRTGTSRLSHDRRQRPRRTRLGSGTTPGSPGVVPRSGVAAAPHTSCWQQPPPCPPVAASGHVPSLQATGRRTLTRTRSSSGLKT